MLLWHGEKETLTASTTMSQVLLKADVNQTLLFTYLMSSDAELVSARGEHQHGTFGEALMIFI